jgi:hypothetical protein
MKNKRYVIMEVNYDNCPIKYIIPHKKTKCMPFKCNECGMHGDTQEQFVKKIETAVEIMKSKIENKNVYLDKIVATFIAEFLGVKK